MVFFSVLYLGAFLLNFLWESGQGILYTAHNDMAAREYVPMMVQMALLDALSINGLYLFTSVCTRSLLWRMDGRNLFLFCLSGTLSAWVVEYASVNLFHAWSYTPAMPMLFMVGLFPLLQLVITGVPAVFMAHASAGLSNA